MTDALVHALAFSDTVRIVAAVTTDAVGQALEIHDTSPTGTAALGRLLTGAALMGATLKDGARVSLQLQGNGPLGMVLARSNDRGEIYGTVTHPHADVPPRADGKLDVGGAVGRQGTLMVSKDVGLREPYVGLVPLASGEIGDDLATYFADSEQVQSAVGVGVLVSAERRVTGAGGFLLQILGGADDATLDLLESRLAEVRDLSRQIEAGQTHEAMLHVLTGGDHRVLSERPLRYFCPFDRAYYASRIASLGAIAVAEAFGDRDTIEVTCEFTRQTYTFDRSVFEALDA